MAKHWFTLTPDQYYLRSTRKGHRNEILFTVLALGLAHWYLWKPRRNALYAPNSDGQEAWSPTRVNGSLFVLNPHEKIELKFLGK